MDPLLDEGRPPPFTRGNTILQHLPSFSNPFSSLKSSSSPTQSTTGSASPSGSPSANYDSDLENVPPPTMKEFVTEINELVDTLASKETIDKLITIFEDIKSNTPEQIEPYVTSLLDMASHAACEKLFSSQSYYDFKESKSFLSRKLIGLIEEKIKSQPTLDEKISIYNNAKKILEFFNGKENECGEFYDPPPDVESDHSKQKNQRENGANSATAANNANSETAANSANSASLPDSTVTRTFTRTPSRYAQFYRVPSSNFGKHKNSNKSSKKCKRKSKKCKSKKCKRKSKK
jgi:hypothetical protein